MSERREKIAELYYRSRTVKFGSFTMSIHRDQPDLPPSPWYMHYPAEQDAGYELLPELHSLIGDEFYEMSQSFHPPLKPKRIAGLPKGALGIAEAYARHYDTYPRNLLKFEKIQHPNGRTEYVLKEGEYEIGDELQPCEDHISGARNNLLFLRAVRRYGLIVTRLLLVVDRQQGGVENLAAQGVKVFPIFTGDAILEYGLAESHITRATFNEVQEYREANRYNLSMQLE